MGHSHITTTQRYCRVANLKVRRDYYDAMEVVLQRMQALEEDEGDARTRRGKERAACPRREPVLLARKTREEGTRPGERSPA